jgi:hypothetical protein
MVLSHPWLVQGSARFAELGEADAYVECRIQRIRA